MVDVLADASEVALRQRASKSSGTSWARPPMRT